MSDVELLEELQARLGKLYEAGIDYVHLDEFKPPRGERDVEQIMKSRAAMLALIPFVNELAGPRLIKLSKEAGVDDPRKFGIGFQSDLRLLNRPSTSRAGLSRVHELIGEVIDLRNHYAAGTNQGIGIKKKGKNAEPRMIKKLAEDATSHGWTAVQWSEFLEVGRTTVTGYKTWDALRVARLNARIQKRSNKRT